MNSLQPELIDRFSSAVQRLESHIAPERLADGNVESELRTWLDGGDAPLPWTHSAGNVTADEWFFITTLYGEMTLDGQRTHIRRFFQPLFVEAAGRDVRNFIPDMPAYNGLRSQWMKARLCSMGSILRERGLTMQEYTDSLRSLERKATPTDPMPALDAIIRDHQATGWKTLSVFIRDCVQGNCFPIDSRVAKELERS